jgi:phospholipid transport system substrate-binding protein
MRTRLFRLILRLPLLLPTLGVIQLCAAASLDDAETTLRKGTDEVLAIAYSGQSNETLPAQVRPFLERYFDFELVTRQAIGPGWRQFSAGEQKRVTDLFSQLMLRTYSARVVGTQRPNITYSKPTTIAADRCEIPTRVSAPSSNEPVTVVYRMIKLPAGWRVYDVLIEGVSFVVNYRAQFDDLVRRGGAPAVIKTLEAKLAAPINSRS